MPHGTENANFNTFSVTEGPDLCWDFLTAQYFHSVDLSADTEHFLHSKLIQLLHLKTGPGLNGRVGRREGKGSPGLGNSTPAAHKGQQPSSSSGSPSPGAGKGLCWKLGTFLLELWWLQSKSAPALATSAWPDFPAHREKWMYTYWVSLFPPACLDLFRNQGIIQPFILWWEICHAPKYSLEYQADLL